MLPTRQGESGMHSTTDEHWKAGLSLLFSPDERPSSAVIEAALATCQTQAQPVREDAGCGILEIVANGLVFELDGLAPAAARCESGPDDAAQLHEVRFYPGHHLSGGLRLAPVTRTLLALAAELAVKLPVRSVVWHPADIAIDPGAFSRMTLAWLAGGAFPAPGLALLTTLSDASVVSRGLAHFVGQEVAVRGLAGETEQATHQLARRVVDRIVRHGKVDAITQFTIEGETLCAEPVQRGNQVWVWRDGSASG